VLPAGSAELAQALRRLEDERVQLKSQTDHLREREVALAEHELEAVEAANRAQSRAETERDRIRGEAASLIEELRREGSALMADLKTGAKAKRELTRMVSEAGAKLDRLAPRAAEVNAEAAEPLRVGDQVELGDIRGELIALDAGRAVIGRGGLRIEVAPERLRRARAVKPAAREPQITVTAAVSEREELLLVGMRAGEALRKLEEFLDQAYLTNQAEVRVVHGIGSGALKKAVHDYLATSPYCASFRQAQPHHGGAGATVVELRQ
jgi:DNA mismatch repair protein MutS2